MPILNFLNRKSKKKSFLVIEIGLERISCAVFEKEKGAIRLKGIGKKSFSRQDEVFDAVLEALDSLAAIVPDFPPTGILGISGGSLETVTTVARFTRENPRKAISPKETEGILNKVVDDLDTGEKRILFSTIANAQIDKVKVSNPLGLKGEKVELSCFVAFKKSQEMELLDRLMNEIDLKVEKVLPSSFAVAKSLENKNLKDAFIFRVGSENSEVTALVDGHISEILPVSLGFSQPQLLPFAWRAAVNKIEKDKYPSLIWVFADSDRVDLEKAKDLLENFDWKAGLGFEISPKIEVASSVQNFSPSDIGVYALGKQGET
ncbi:MAG: hypothetical protein WD187_04220 [Candidatus Woykebacteria bacterium]